MYVTVVVMIETCLGSSLLLHAFLQSVYCVNSLGFYFPCVKKC